jgi:hypothetical protein
MCLGLIQELSIVVTAIGTVSALFISIKGIKIARANIKALYNIRKSEIDLILREERKVFFDEVSNILSGIFEGIESYMAAKKNDFHSTQKKIRILEREANYSLDKDSQKIFSEIIEHIDKVIENYNNFFNRKANPNDPYPIPAEQRRLNSEALNKLIKLEDKYLNVENLYPTYNTQKLLFSMLKRVLWKAMIFGSKTSI